MTSGGDGARPVFKVAAAALVLVGLVLVVASAVKIFGTKPAEPAAADVTEPSPPEPAADVKPSMPALRPPAPSRVNVRPADVRPAVSGDQPGETMASKLWAAAGPPAEPAAEPHAEPQAGRQAGSNKLILGRLPTLQPGVDGVVARFEPPVFYHVADRFAGEMRGDFAQIANATNFLKQSAADFRALQAGLEADRQDYLRHARAADESRQNAYAAAMKRKVDLQALYLERKRQYQQDSAVTRPTLQDPPGIFERKLAQFERVRKNYENDINQLEAGILDVTKQVAEAGQGLRGISGNLNRAFEESVQDAIGRLIGLSNQVSQQIRGVNTLIDDYNSKLARYGTPLERAR